MLRAAVAASARRQAGALRHLATSASAGVQPKVLVYGGGGALGQAALQLFNAEQWHTVSCDVNTAQGAQESYSVSPDLPMKEASAELKKHILAAHEPGTFDMVFCTAGGWAGGDISSDSVFDGVEAMYHACIQSSVLAAHLASTLLRPQGTLVLTGSEAARAGTPGMIGYGMAKAATHQLVASLAAGGLPSATVVGILPLTIDTPGNRAGMPGVDTSTWTSPTDIAKKALELHSGGGVETGTLLTPQTTAVGNQWIESRW